MVSAGAVVVSAGGVVVVIAGGGGEASAISVGSWGVTGGFGSSQPSSVAASAICAARDRAPLGTDATRGAAASAASQNGQRVSETRT